MMMMTPYFLCFGSPSFMLLSMNEAFLEDVSAVKKKFIAPSKDMDCRSKKLVLSIQLDAQGFCLPLYEWLSGLKNKDFTGSSAVLMVHSENEWFTKKMVQDVIFLLNHWGCHFMGRPFVEATANLKNFLTLQKVHPGTLEEVCLYACKKLSQRFLKAPPLVPQGNRLLILHASNYDTSNTLAFWHRVEAHLKVPSCQTIHIENGTVRDCKGCPYKTCVHFGQQSRCFYGGIMVEEIYPAILASDALLMLCPNYNDALSANLSAVINRLTALFRKNKFYQKALFGIVVSGSSGSDIVAKQLISALHCNKTFLLAPHAFALITANDFGAVAQDPENEIKAQVFAKTIDDYFTP